MTQSKKENSKQKEQERTLLEAQMILQAAGDGIYGIDADGFATFVNQSAVDLLGWEIEDLVGTIIHDLHHHTRADGSHYPREECPIYHAIVDGKVHHETDEVFWKKDGTAVPVEYVSTPIINNNKIIGSVIVFKDISERKKSEKKLNAALEEITKLKEELRNERDYLREEIENSIQFGEMIGTSPALQEMLVQIEAVAKTPVNVLICGESGTGKELTARAIHSSSDRSEKPLIKVNCASIPKDLFESEFFGHVKGSFTGAHRDRVGRFELADGGTLFLDEVGEIPLDLQAKLLRVLQEHEFERIGDEKTRTIDVRVIAATNRDLEKEVKDGNFREDLFYRLSVFPVEVPPLRNRRKDIVPLALHFLKKQCASLGKSGIGLSRIQGQLLENYKWPGNIRELEHVIARAAILSTNSRLQLDSTFLSSDSSLNQFESTSTKVLEEPKILTAKELKLKEKENIVAALKHSHWRVSGKGGAAELLGIKATTLAHQMKKFDIKKPSNIDR